jgi:hypothetical protein
LKHRSKKRKEPTALKIMLDTNAYSSYLGGHRFLKGLLGRADIILMTPIVLGELFAGIRERQE